MGKSSLTFPVESATGAPGNTQSDAEAGSSGNSSKEATTESALDSDSLSEPTGSPPAAEHPLREVVLLFLRMGFTAFGGSAAHIAIYHDEVVIRRKWLTDAEFLDLMAAANLIPGPNSTEMTMHLGYIRAGWKGLILGGIAFILPAFLLVTGFAALYVHYGTTPTVQWLLYGVQPVVIAIILQAIWVLSRSTATSPLMVAIIVASFVIYFFGVHELIILFGAGLIVVLVQNRHHLWAFAPALLPTGLSLTSVARAAVQQPAVPISLTVLFLTFLKIGAILYGNGYVLVAFLETEFVNRLGWITSTQLVNAVAVGQFTPGPIFTTATFVGYLVAGPAGAVLATVAIFLPSFIFIAIINPYIPRLRHSTWLSALLDGVVASSLGLMAAVTVDLARESIIDIPAGLIAIVAAALLFRFRINSTLLIVGGAAVGYLLSVVMG